MSELSDVSTHSTGGGSTRTPQHVGPNILPNFPVFCKLLAFAAGPPSVCIIDVAHGFRATHVQLLSDVLRLRNELQTALDDKTLERLMNGDEVFFNILAPGGYEFAVGFLAILAIGGVVVPLSISIPTKEAAYFAETSRSVAVLTSSTHLHLGQSLTRHLNRTSNSNYKILEILPHICKSPLDVSKIVISSDHYLDYNGSGLVIFTSGTTGPPKGTVKTRAFLDITATTIAHYYQIGPGDIVMHSLPVHHATGIGITFMPFLLAHAAIEFRTGGFDPAEVWERWRLGDLTVFSGVPTMYMRLMRYFEQEIEKKREPSVVMEYVAAARGFKAMMSGTSALPHALQTKWMKLLGGKRILERYGATEFSSALMTMPWDDSVPDGSVGRVVPGLDIKLSEGDTGEILIRSPFMFTRYLFDPVATANAFSSDGYYKTGDIGRKEGPYYFIMGRASIDIIKSGGYKISAWDIEREIIPLEYVSEVMVVGVDDEEYGQRVAAAVTLRDSRKSLSIEDLRRDLRPRLAGYKLPTLLRVVPKFAKTGSGKIPKKTLRNTLFPQGGHNDIQRWTSTYKGSKL